MQRTALITGASSGIGLDLARLFAADKWDVALVARTEPKLRELAAQIEKEHGITAHVVAADLARPEAPAEIVKTLTDRGIAIEALVNNAGFGLAGEIAETSPSGELEMSPGEITPLPHPTKITLPPSLVRQHGAIPHLTSPR